MANHYFKSDCLNKINHLIHQFQLNLYPRLYTETSSLAKFDLIGIAKVSELKRLEDDFKNLLGEKTVLEVKNGIVSIVLPKPNFEVYPLMEILESDFFKSIPGKLKIAVGENADGAKVVGDLEKWVHLLVAGETGGGKSVFIHSLITSLIFNNTPEELKLVLIDLKRVEFPVYNNISYLALPISYDLDAADKNLKWLIEEMNRRFKILQSARCRNIKTYNERNYNQLPYIVVVIDEFANLTLDSKESEKLIIKLAQMARAAGIHLVLSTQKPSAEIVTPLIKANIPTRIAFAVPSFRDSMVILDETGAENLNKRGDMLLKDEDGIERVQGAYISDEDIEKILQRYYTDPNVIECEEVLEVDYIEVDEEREKADEMQKLFVRAAEESINRGKCNHWFLKQKLKIGNEKANELLILLQENGIISNEKNGHNYDILIGIDDFNDIYKESEVNGS